ncbi:Outer arm dynein light chain 1 protein [Zea mays]|uniref:Outer arm dynein light chain 1 protein n=1 Tax=Zea mays TaxID=4577 RepID=A0A1D6KXM2_MAIZE|nr:Outer arm dynein light chain 1 protein [Zea mays]
MAWTATSLTLHSGESDMPQAACCWSFYVSPYQICFSLIRELNCCTAHLFREDHTVAFLMFGSFCIVRVIAGALPKGLHMLILSKNNISIIERLRELTRLRLLDINYNRISRIGHGLASCSSLKELYLVGNKISEVDGLHRLLKLKVLDLCHIQSSVATILGVGAEDARKILNNYGTCPILSMVYCALIFLGIIVSVKYFAHG